ESQNGLRGAGNADCDGSLHLADGVLDLADAVRYLLRRLLAEVVERCLDRKRGCLDGFESLDELIQLRVGEIERLAAEKRCVADGRHLQLDFPQSLAERSRRGSGLLEV